MNYVIIGAGNLAGKGVYAIISFGLLAILLGVGCKIPERSLTAVLLESEPYKEAPPYPGGKVVSWCDTSDTKEANKKRENNELWVSSEMFNGMNHAATIRHVCRGKQELFFMEMDWVGKTAAKQTGKFVTGDKKTAFKFSVSNWDPEFTLLDTQAAQHPGEVWMRVEGKIFVFDEQEGVFYGGR